MNACEVLIVGGGPAGSTCARHLVRAGLDVAVIDKSEFPRDKVCAGWITPPVLETLSLDAEHYRRGRVLQPIKGFRTGVIGGPARSTAYRESVSYGIRRCEFDHYLLERSGARLRLGETVGRIERTADGWLVNGSLRARMLVGAGGHFCPVARLLGARVGREERAISAQEIEFRLNEQTGCGVAPEQPELYFCPDLSGYGWCFRKGEYLNVGLGRDDNHGLAEAVREFWGWLEAQGKVPAGMVPRMKGHAYLLHGHSARPQVDDGVLAVGDAAGLAYTQSGEGIRPAVESGVLAAQAIIAAGGAYDRARLASYGAALAARFGRPGATAPEAQTWPGGLRARLGRRLLANGWFVRHVVLNRWFLHAQQPALRPLESW